MKPQHNSSNGSLNGSHHATSDGNASTGRIIRLFGLTALVMTAAILFIFNQPFTPASVGSIRAPAGLEHLQDGQGQQSPVDALQDYRRNRAFLDSVETLGEDRMMELYQQNQSKPNSYD
jgi:hypothetical protein